MPFSRLFCLFALSLLFLGTGSQGTLAAVPRDALLKNVQQQSEAVLLEQLDLWHDPSIDHAQVRAQIALRTRRFADTIQNLPMSKVDDDLAAWIQQSMVAELKALGLDFVHNPKSLFFESYRKNAAKHFTGLTNAKGKQLL